MFLWEYKQKKKKWSEEFCGMYSQQLCLNYVTPRYAISPFFYSFIIPHKTVTQLVILLAVKNILKYMIFVEV